MSSDPKRNDPLDPPLHMRSVAYSQVCVGSTDRITSPIADDWRMYVVRGDRVILNAADIGTGSAVLQPGTVIGISGKVRHSFAGLDWDGGPGSDAAWVERPLGEPVDQDDAVIAMSRIPQSSKPFVPLLGAFLRVDPDEHPDITARIGVLIDLTAEETTHPDFGSADVIVRLAEVITIQLRRVGRARGMFLGTWPRNAEHDPQIWSVMSAISSEPQRRWTVGSMAAVAGMSRSAFAIRYREAVGQTPMRSLRRLRMQTAATTLTSHGSPLIGPLAGALGYGSDEAFNRAFVREFGQPPKRYRVRNANIEDHDPKA